MLLQNLIVYTDSIFVGFYICFSFKHSKWVVCINGGSEPKMFPHFLIF